MSDIGNAGPFQRGNRLLEQYEVTRLLGTGGHAYVYECRDLFLDELLAVKVIPNPPNRGRELLDRARAEAQLLRRLSHPNVVRMHTAAALGDDMVCLVMEKLAGVSLRHLLALLQRFSLIEAAAVVRQVAIGVAAAHQLNVVHRDIKPDNVFVLPPNNHVKVLDFGIAKFLGHGLQTSNKYRFQGTPLYMSPEHLRGSGVTVRSDVYQLGTVLFELVTGINPNLIDLDNPGFEQVAFVQITRPTPPISRIVAGLPRSLDDLIQRATAKDPELRFASMDDFVQALDRTTEEFAAAHPSEAGRVRYVDEALMQAAQQLAAREEQAVAANSRANTALIGVHTDVDSKLRSSHHSVPPLSAQSAATKTSPPPNSFSVANGGPQPEKLASFHPVPPQLPAVDSPLPGPRFGTRVSRPPAPSRSGISIPFALAATAFGIVAGGLILWFLPRGNEAMTEPAAAASETASSPSAAEPAVIPPPTAAVASVAASGKPIQELRRTATRNDDVSRSVIGAAPASSAIPQTDAVARPAPSVPSSAPAAAPGAAPSNESAPVVEAQSDGSETTPTLPLDRTGTGSTDRGRRIMTGDLGSDRSKRP